MTSKTSIRKNRFYMIIKINFSGKVAYSYVTSSGTFNEHEKNKTAKTGKIKTLINTYNNLINLKKK